MQRDKKVSSAWLLLVLFVALSALLGACVRRGAVGGLEVTISGLPAGVPAVVDVAGPNGFTTHLTESAALSRLPVGSYTVSAGPVVSAAGTYTGTVNGSPATVGAGTTASVTVSYALGNGGGGGAGGDISGTVSIVSAAETDVTADFVPGEVIVKVKQGIQAQALTGLRPLRDLGLADTRLYEFSGLRGQSGDARANTLRAVAELAARADVVYAHPNYLLEATAEPSDPLYAEQWHLRAINLPAAWNQTTGSTDVTVAVVDSGIVPTHPDLAPKLWPGYDFVGADFSDDGDGRDGDPTDPAGSFHGSHVAGTVAAATDNGVGVAGVSWGGRLLPVRVLGTETGTLADAIDGILWSVGESVPGVPSNPNPADVLNLSLGGPFLCADVPAFQDAFDRAVAAGATVVVAAGNDDDDASFFTPASCGNVITVGATTLRNERAPYSNYGARIDVVAPGGNLDEDADGDGEPDGVLSTVFDLEAGEPSYAYFQGTSMASPHVAGVAALLKSVQPTLTNAEVRDILRSTATPLTGASCPEGCGAGLVNAATALASLAAPVAPDFELSLSPASVSLVGGESATVRVSISRSGGLTGEVAFSVSGLPNGLSASFEPPVTTGDSAALTLTASADLSGAYTLSVQGVGGGVSRTVALRVTLEESPPEPTADIEGTLVGACYFVNNRCDPTLSKVVEITQTGTSAPYTISGLSATPYFIAALKDGNEDEDFVDADDYAGVYLQNGQQGVTPPATGINITMTPRIGTQGLSDVQLEAVLNFLRSR